MTPEQKARLRIDQQLQQCGWAVQDFAEDSGELMEGCVHAPGRRRLLAFNFAAGNVGDYRP